MTANKLEPRKSNLILGNLTGRDFTRETSRKMSLCEKFHIFAISRKTVLETPLVTAFPLKPCKLELQIVPIVSMTHASFHKSPAEGEVGGVAMTFPWLRSHEQNRKCRSVGRNSEYQVVAGDGRWHHLRLSVSTQQHSLKWRAAASWKKSYLLC